MFPKFLRKKNTFDNFFASTVFSPLALALFLCQIAHFSLMAICASSFALWLKTTGLATSNLTFIISLEALMRPTGFALALLFSIGGERRTLLVAVLMAGICLLVVPLFLTGFSFALLAILVVLLFIPLWLILPLVETGALRVADQTGIEVGKIIGFGAVVFGLALLGGGVLFEKYSLAFFPWVLLFLFMLQLFAFWNYRRVRLITLEMHSSKKSVAFKNSSSTAAVVDEKHRTSHRIQAISNEKNAKAPKKRQRMFPVPFLKVFRQNIVLTLAVFASAILFGSIFAHGAYAALLWNENGWGTARIGLLLSMGLVGELFFFFIYKTKNKTNRELITLSIITVVATATRWVVTGYFIESFFVQLVAQFSNALSFPSMYLVVIALITRHAKKKNLELWQSFYFLAAQGVAPALAIGVVGYFFEQYGVGYYYFLSAYTLLALPVLYMLGKKLLVQTNMQRTVKS